MRERASYIDAQASKNPLKKFRNWAQKRFGRIVKEITVGENTTLAFVPSGREILDKTKDLITTAQHYSYTQSYTFEKDAVGDEFLHVFKDASSAHPQVKYGLLVDQIIAMHNQHGIVRRNNHAALEYRTQVFDMLQDLNQNGHAQVVVTNSFNVLGGWASNVLHRDHKKASVADGTKAVIGSANVGAHHVRWLDAGMYLEGPGARVIEEDVVATFAKAKEWERVHKTKDIREYGRRYGWVPKGKDIVGAIARNRQDRGQHITVKQPNGETLQILTDSWLPWYQEATNEGFHMIAHAQKDAVVDVTSPYPGVFSLTRRMRKAARNGAEVNLYVPANNNSPIYNPKSDNLQFAPLRPILEFNKHLWHRRLRRAGVHLYEFEGEAVNEGMIHAKTVRVKNADNSGELLVGSMNLGKGLVTHWDREIGVKVSNKGVLDDYDGFIQKVKSQSKKIF